jgi:hypothetical protein
MFVGVAMAQPSTMVVAYTDGFSNSATLTLTGTIISPNVFHVTGVSGVFDGAAVMGLVPSFSGSGNFYINPAVLPNNTIDTGFEFQTTGGAETVNLYEYNFGGVQGYANTVSGTLSNGSGAVSISRITQPTPTPAPSAGVLTLAALGCMGVWRKLVVGRGGLTRV